MTEKHAESYLEEITDTGWVAEVICERFDNALEMISDTHSVIYGGAIRDVLAGKELQGDLDITVIPEEGSEISKRFHENPRWIPCKDVSPSQTPFNTFGVTSFSNMNGVVVQLVTTGDYGKDRMQAAMYPARMVDLVCCGIIMLHDGRVFEVVPNAYKDCKDGVLRLNEYSNTLTVESLPQRIEKLTSRGWKSLIDIDKAIRTIKAKQNKAKKTQQSPLDQMFFGTDTRTNEEEINQFMFVGDNKDDWFSGGEMQELGKNTINLFSSVDDILATFKHFSKKLHVNIRVVISPRDKILYECRDKQKSYNVFKEFEKMKPMIPSKDKAPTKQIDVKSWIKSLGSKNKKEQEVYKHAQIGNRIAGETIQGKMYAHELAWSKPWTEIPPSQLGVVKMAGEVSDTTGISYEELSYTYESPPSVQNEVTVTGSIGVSDIPEAMPDTVTSFPKMQTIGPNGTVTAVPLGKIQCFLTGSSLDSKTFTLLNSNGDVNEIELSNSQLVEMRDNSHFYVPSVFEHLPLNSREKASAVEEVRSLIKTTWPKQQ
jgi:hypothetical protein